MSANITRATSSPQTAVDTAAPAYPAVAPYGQGPGGALPPEQEGGGNLSPARILAAIGRYKWLVALLVIVGGIAGAAATRYLDPKYLVRSSILLTADQSRGGQSGPIRVENEFDPQGWIDLIQSFAIADSVVMELSLYVEPDRAEDAGLFRDFALVRSARGFYPGEFTLKTEKGRWNLRDKLGIINESGIVGDSIGRTAGFAWRPAGAALGSDRTVKFIVRTPRETSVEILSRMRVSLARGSSIILMQLTGTAQQKPAQTLNAWGEHFVRIATDLKNRRVSQYTKILSAQRAEAADRLTAAESALQQFRVAAITKPGEGTPVRPGTGGIEMVRDPVLDNFFQQKQLASNLRRDRELLERVAQQVKSSETPVAAILSVQTVAADPLAEPLRISLREYMQREAQVRLLRETLTDSHPTVAPRLAELRTLQAQIPVQLADVLSQLRTRENNLNTVIEQSERDLQGIPARTINEEVLRREVFNASQLYTTLQQRYAEADLAERSTIADVRVLDPAVMPLDPTSNTTPMIIAVALAGSLALGLGLAVLLDQVDRRFRYPSQATNTLGLQILGVVPVVDQSPRQSPEHVAQIVEAFRTIRMNVRYGCIPATRVAVTITSPGANDGKSLVASNLALSFAEGGWRTVLIDADLRRGQLCTTFDLPQSPGLVEYLEGTSLLGEVLYQTTHENLTLVPSGTRHRRGPELLATPRMQELIAALGRDFDAIIVDTPPLGAGTDAYAVGTATGNMAIVLRGATTDVKLAQAKLNVLDNLPVRVIGAVLNGVETAGSYEYYAYDPDYGVIEDAPASSGQLTATAGSR